MMMMMKEEEEEEKEEKMYKSVVYHGNDFLGEVEIYPGENNYTNNNINSNIIDLKEIRISHFSQASERCPPLAVLHTITSNGVCFKMESKTSQSQNSQLFLLHSSCLMENKTAVMQLGGEELHLVAMCSRSNNKQYPCFWAFNIAPGIYDSCLVMLNLRCLAIVFDLDETLIVANTMRSFEDRIEALQRKLSSEVDPQRIAGMLAEVKRYQDDKIILKQYAENDQIVENGKLIKVQSEVVAALSDKHQPIVRPIIRLNERNIILTRINPQIRDTSVLVRLRPAWEDLRSYLTARGRKRFEVYVCTMAERDYAFEMWRLLDPDSNLISSKELLDRIVCVKSGSRKSLFNVFQDGFCHPKMALVIDDRLKVWNEKDQPRVHVVPAYAPYFTPHSEENIAVPILCVARNVACNVRGGFFKEFDECLLPKIPEITFEDDVKDIPCPPDVSSYLVSEDDSSVANGNKDPVPADGMADAEVEKRLKDAILSSTVTSTDPRLAPSLQYAVTSASGSTPLPIIQASMTPYQNKQFPQSSPIVKAVTHAGPTEPSLQNSPAREEGEVPESELDPDTRRRLLILQHGQDIREQGSSEPAFPVRPPVQVSAPPQVQSHGGWFPGEDEMSPQKLSRAVPKDFSIESGLMHVEKQRPLHPPFFPKAEGCFPHDRILHENQRLAKEAFSREDRLRLNYAQSSYHSFPGEEVPMNQKSSSNMDIDFEPGQSDPNVESPVGVLQEIAMKCGTKADFRHALVPCSELQFSSEAWFAGEKIGKGIGRTRREAQRQAAEGSIKNLADMYILRGKTDSGPLHNKFPLMEDNGYAGSVSSFGNQLLPRDESVSFLAASESPRPMDPRLEGSKRPMGSVFALKELCMMEGLRFSFQHQPPPSVNSVQNDEVYAQVEVDGQIMGRGIGLTWDDAKMQAAEKALGNLRSVQGPFTPKWHSSPRPPSQAMSSKRLKPEFPRVLQRVPSSARYPKNAPPVP